MWLTGKKLNGNPAKDGPKLLRNDSGPLWNIIAAKFTKEKGLLLSFIFTFKEIIQFAGAGLKGTKQTGQTLCRREQYRTVGGLLIVQECSIFFPF